MGLHKKNHRDCQKGQNLVELAMVLPFLFVILFGVLDLGRVFFASISLTNAAREGVRFLTLHPDDLVNVYLPYWGSKKAAIEEANYSGVTLSEGDISVECLDEDDNDFCDPGTPASVEVTYDFDLILGWILPSPITVSRSAVMVIP
jgi:hypothetical protein